MIPYVECPSYSPFIPYRVQQAFRDRYILLICKYIPSNKKYLLEHMVQNKELVVRDYGTKLDIFVRNTGVKLLYITGCEFLYNVKARKELTCLQKELDNAYARQMVYLQCVQKARTQTP